MKNKILSAISMSIIVLCTQTIKAEFTMACLKHARSGQDQKLYGHYHVSYATSDNYHCYFSFDPKDVIWIPLRQARNIPDLKNLRWLPSYQAKIIYFTNPEPYSEIINALKKPGKTLKHLRSLKIKKGNMQNIEAPVYRSYKNIKKNMPLLYDK